MLTPFALPQKETQLVNYCENPLPGTPPHSRFPIGIAGLFAQGPLNGGVSNGGFPDLDLSILFCPFFCHFPCPSFPCFFFGKRQEKPPKKQGFFIPSEPLKSVEKKGKTLKKKRNSSQGKKGMLCSDAIA